MDEILHLQYNCMVLAVKALNRAKTIPEAASLLNVSERTLQRWKKEWGIKKEGNLYKLPSFTWVMVPCMPESPDFN